MSEGGIKETFKDAKYFFKNGTLPKIKLIQTLYVLSGLSGEDFRLIFNFIRGTAPPSPSCFRFRRLSASLALLARRRFSSISARTFEYFRSLGRLDEKSESKSADLPDLIGPSTFLNDKNMNHHEVMTHVQCTFCLQFVC